MRLDRFIRRGDEIHCKGKDNEFVSKIISFIDEDTFTADLPSGSMIIRKGDIYEVSCITETGIHKFETTVIECKDPQSSNCLNMKVIKYRNLIQRRETFRVAENLSVEMCKVSDEASVPCKWQKTTTLNISEMGMLVKFNEPCEPGQKVIFNLYIDLLGIKTQFNNLSGEVVRCNEIGKKKEYLLGINFTGIPDRAREEIMKLVILSQRESLAHKKYKEVSRLWDKRS